MSEEQENLALVVPEEKPRHAPTLYFIIALKIVKGTLLLLVALGVYSLAGKDLGDLFDQFLRHVHLDPENKFFSAIGDRLDTVTPANVKLVASGTFLLGAFLLTCGVGLACRAHWAIWVVIGESAFFVPVEIYELVRRPSYELLLVLAVNVLVVCYLFFNRQRLFRHHHNHH